MITQELVSYIKAQLAKGKTREQIHAELVTHGGWTEVDMAEAFAVAIPAPMPDVPLKPLAPDALPIEPVQVTQTTTTFSAPIAAAPVQPTPAPAFVAPAPQPVAAPSFVQPKTKNYFLMGICLYVISLAVTFAVNIATLKQKSPQLFMNHSAMIAVFGIEIVLMAIGFLLGVFIIHKLAKAFKAIAPTWGKAALLGSTSVMFTAILTLIRHSATISGLLVLAVFGASVIIFIVIAERLYQFRPGKAFLLWLCSLIVEVLLAVVIAFVLAFVIATTAVVVLKTRTAPSTYQIPTQPSQQTVPQSTPYFPR